MARDHAEIRQVLVPAFWPSLVLQGRLEVLPRLPKIG